MPLKMRLYRQEPGDLVTEAEVPLRGEVPPSRSVLMSLLVDRHLLQDSDDLKPLCADIVSEESEVLIRAEVPAREPTA